MPQVSVVIGTLGDYETLGRVLDGYAAQSAPATAFELVVVVDAADPHPERVDALLRDRPFAARRLTGPAPGASANRNAGWRAAEAPLLLFTDNDVIPRRRLVAEHVAWHARRPEETVGVLGRVRWSREVEITTFMRWLDRGFQFNYLDVDPEDAGWGRFVTANVSIKRSFMERVGDFDQEHFPYGYEDTDWAYRASREGFHVLYNRRAAADHLRTMSLELFQRRMRRVAFSEYAFTQLHPELPPWFHRLLTDAQTKPVPRGRAVKLARFVPPATPWLGRTVWDRVDIHYRQALAPHFLAAWQEAEAQGLRPGAAPDLAEEAVNPSGSRPAGPK